MPTRDRPARRVRHRWAAPVGCLALAVGSVFVAGYVAIDQLLPRAIPQGCSVQGGEQRLSYGSDQLENAATISAIGMKRGLPARAVTIALATAMQESKLRNLDYGDRDSLGLFQQRPSQGWGNPKQLQDPVYSTNEFYRHLVKVDNYADKPLTQVAQKVQRSGFPDAYAKHEENAITLTQGLTGARPGAVTCRLDPPTRTSSVHDVAADLTEQFGIKPQAADGRIVAVVSNEKLAWATGAWAVAHAQRTGATSVSVGDQRWQRSRDKSAASWSRFDTTAGPTEVTIAFTGPR
ncbi:hypothetical protein [Gephyromycinifex aptenodytis]|uniref:hypothetical protein n=1 Tax=Gephyromycinifex aptenodytis TaxID=2716227 RepID=UPI001447F177|nr:hypothetical protein [Gephyromycinifex aptenodytis]